MITRIELSNFMSHAHTVIEPAAGLTVLVGPNNCGKSAVVAALQILCHNDNSTYVLRHGEKECCVRIETDDGHVIEWRRKNSPSYKIDEQLFDRLRVGGLPDELHKALRLPRVDAGGDGEFDVHFGSQKSPIFLLDRSPATAARFFASSSDAIRLVQMQRRHRDKLGQRQRDKNRLEAESRQLNAELEALAPAIELDHRLTSVEQLHGELVQEAARLVQADRDQAALGEQLGAVARHAAHWQTLAPLVQPPELAPTQPLATLADGLARAQSDADRSLARAQSLAELPTPPTLYDEKALATSINRQSALAASVLREEGQRRAIQPLDRPPALADTDHLSKLVVRLATAERDALAGAARHGSLAEMAQPPGLGDQRALSKLVDDLAQAERRLALWQETAGRVVVEAPSQHNDASPLADFLSRVETAADHIGRSAAELQAAQAELAATEAALRELAATQLCPTCGSPLDPDRLLAGAAAGLGEHAHG